MLEIEETIKTIRNLKEHIGYGEKVQQALQSAISHLEELQRLKDNIDVEKIEKLMIDGLTEFTKKPIGTLEGDLCDWNKPSQFACKPIDIQNRVKDRLGSIAQAIYDYLTPQEKDKLNVR